MPPLLGWTVPRGPLGYFAGRAMADGNADMAHEVVSRLHLTGSERVLDIGFGPGVGVARLAAALPEGEVCGVDPSPTMLRLAESRNEDAIRAGRVDLRLGTAGDLPWPDDYFDGVCSANSVMLWDPLDAAVRELRRVVKASGHIAIGVHEWSGRHFRPPRELDEEVTAALHAGGFGDVSLSRAAAKSGDALYWS